MPETEKTTSPPSKSSALVTWIWQGVTFAAVMVALAAGFTWKGEIQTTLREHTDKLNKISDSIFDPKQGITVQLARIEERLVAVDSRVIRLEEWTKTISPKIVKSEFDQEIKRLNARIDMLKSQLEGARAELAREHEASRRLRSQVDVLQNELRQTAQSLETTRTELARQSRELEVSQEIRKQLRELDSQLSEVTNDLGLLTEETKSTKITLPEDYRSSLVERLTKLLWKLEELRRRLRGNAA